MKIQRRRPLTARRTAALAAAIAVGLGATAGTYSAPAATHSITKDKMKSSEAAYQRTMASSAVEQRTPRSRLKRLDRRRRLGLEHELVNLDPGGPANVWPAREHGPRFVVVVLDEGALPRLALGPAREQAGAEAIRDAVRLPAGWSTAVVRLREPQLVDVRAQLKARRGA
jgi:hypothetical protein